MNSSNNFTINAKGNPDITKYSWTKQGGREISMSLDQRISASGPSLHINNIREDGLFGTVKFDENNSRVEDPSQSSTILGHIPVSIDQTRISCFISNTRSFRWLLFTIKVSKKWPPLSGSKLEIYEGNERNISYVRLAHTSIFGLCFMKVINEIKLLLFNICFFASTTTTNQCCNKDLMIYKASKGFN